MSVTTWLRRTVFACGAVPHARVVYIPGARHYVFLTHPGEVEHAMLEFLLSPGTRP